MTFPRLVHDAVSAPTFSPAHVALHGPLGALLRTAFRSTAGQDDAEVSVGRFTVHRQVLCPRNRVEMYNVDMEKDGSFVRVVERDRLTEDGEAVSAELRAALRGSDRRPALALAL